ncbi:MAG: efflux RND transporter permease subunit [Pseudomonadota bacterium]
MQLSEIAVRRPVFAAVLSLLLVIFGLVSLQRLGLRQYPDIDRPVVSITTRYTGASASVMETKVTQLIEDSIAGIEGILKIESDSEDERSSVRIEFNVNRDLDGAANDVRDRVARVVGNLPQEADPPEVLKADASAEAVMFISFSSEHMTPLELTDYAERSLVDRFSTVPGVARVTINGARRAAMRIWIDRQALAARALTVTDIEDALRRENVEIPAGRIESRDREFSLRTLVGLDTEQDFRNLVISRGEDDHLIRLGEVARVQLAAANERSMTRLMGRSGLHLAVEAQSKGNTLDIARALRAQIDLVQKTLPAGARLGITVDNAVAIEAALREVVIAVAFALVAVLVVIYAFLGSLRATFIPAVTIPVAIVASLTFMYAMGYSINVLTLLGMVLAIGLVVDDSIVVLENIHRRTELGEAPLVAAVTGGREIGFAVIATTLTLTAVFVPISFLPGDLGRLFREFGFTLAASVVCSALVALTLTPMMASKLPAHAAERGRVAAAVDRVFGRLSAFYEHILRRLVLRPWLVIVALLAVIGIAGLTLRTVPTEFTPTADVGRLFMNLEGPEGATVEYMDGQLRQLEALLAEEMKRGEIERYFTRIPGGGGGGANAGGNVNSARAILILTDWHARQRTAREIADDLLAKSRARLPGVHVSVGLPGSLGRGGFGAPVQAVIGGPDYETLSTWSRKMLAVAKTNPGLTNVDTTYRERKPQIRVNIDRNRAADLGVSLQLVGRTLETILGSRIVTTFVRDGREYDVILQADETGRETITDLTNISVRSTRSGAMIPLLNVVQLQESSGAIQLPRFNRLRSIEIQADLAPGYTMGEAVRWFQDAVPRELPDTATLMWDGESGEFVRTGEQLYFTFFFALAIVYLVLAAQFESFVYPLIIMVTVPLALLGAVFGLKAYGMTINIFSQIAVVMLVGIAAKNGVLIVEFANQLRDRGVQFAEAVCQAAIIRLRPVLMTSLCTAFSAIPLLLATGAGAEQRRPIGIVVFYGTLVSVFLTLLAVPAVYALVARRTRSPQHVSRVLDRLMGTG